MLKHAVNRQNTTDIVLPFVQNETETHEKYPNIVM